MTVATAYKGWQTRRLNQARLTVWQRFRAGCIAQTGFFPSILPVANGGFDLMWNRGYGIRCLNFRTREEALDFVASLGC